MGTRQEDPSSKGRGVKVFAVLGAVAFMAQLDLFIVNLALPDMADSFGHASLGDLSWILNSYSIVLAALLVPAGRLADQLGRRRFFLLGVGVFTLASIICAIAPSLPVLVAGRAVQGLGAALIVPTSLGLLFAAFSPEDHSLVVGLWAGVAAIAAASGPTVGGLLVAVDWRLIFLVNVPIGGVTLVAGLRVLPEVRAKGSRSPDVVSSLALLAAITLLSLGLIQSGEWGWGDPRTIALVLVSAVAASVTFRRTLTHEDALIEASLFRSSREFSTAAIALLLFFCAFACWLLVTVLFLQDAWHYGPIQTGLAVLPGPATAAVFALGAGPIVARFGRRKPAIVGPLCFAAGSLFWLLVTPSHPDYVAGFLPGLLVAGVGSGLTQAPLFASVSTLVADRATTGSAVLNMCRQVGSAIGIAILVTLTAGEKSSMAGWQRGWCFMTVCFIGAAAVVSTSGTGCPVSATPLLKRSRTPASG